MTNDNNTPKSASHMLFHELVANRGTKHTYFCDHCGDPVDSDNVIFFHTLPQDIASANKGESATTCRKCCEMIDANANNEDFKRNYK